MSCDKAEPRNWAILLTTGLGVQPDISGYSGDDRIEKRSKETAANDTMLRESLWSLA